MTSEDAGKTSYELWIDAEKKVERLEAEIERLTAALDRAADALEFYDNKAEAQKARRALEGR